MNPTLELLILDAAPEQAHTLRERLCERGFTIRHEDLTQAGDGSSGKRPDLAIMVAGDGEDVGVAERAADVLTRLSDQKVTTVVWGAADGIRQAGGAHAEWLDPSMSIDEVVGRLSTLARYVPLVSRLERELDHVHRLGEQLNRYFSEIDQEMRLAGRLQRDFLPRHLPELPGLRFATLYRPASWVSGDMYDAFRIDEHHIGLFLADAMGHGVAAGLLTMFLRQALVPKHISGSSYAIVSPVDAMANLNDCLVRQKLPNCQFVTAIYAVYNIERRELRLARGGHPHPLRIPAGGGIEPICVGGSLLGLPDVPAEFDEACTILDPGDKIVLFTDGLEDDFFTHQKNQPGSDQPSPALHEWAKLDVQGLTDALSTHLDSKEGSLHPADDVTLLAFEVL